MSRLAMARDQLVFARTYTLRLLEQTSPTDWFRLPAGGVSHVAWQVGHLAGAEYRLVLERLRGTQPGDGALLPDSYFALFGRESVPDADATRYPGAAELRATLDRVHEATLQAIASLTEAELDQTVARPHPLFTTKLGGIVWCANHEMLHAGQIGLLRRELGYKPLW